MAPKSLPITLLLTYQAEYENTPDLTIEQLCEKYNIRQSQLKGWQQWEKNMATSNNIDTNSDVTSIDTSSDVDTIGTSRLPQLLDTQDIEVLENTSEDAEVFSDIAEFKKLAVAHALKFMKKDAEFAEIKEFKDVVAIVDSLEKSYTSKKNPDDTKLTINIAIQNLVERFKDDC